MENKVSFEQYIQPFPTYIMALKKRSNRADVVYPLRIYLHGARNFMRTQRVSRETAATISSHANESWNIKEIAVEIANSLNSFSRLFNATQCNGSKQIELIEHCPVKHAPKCNSCGIIATALLVTWHDFDVTLICDFSKRTRQSWTDGEVGFTTRYSEYSRVFVVRTMQLD